MASVVNTYSISGNLDQTITVPSVAASAGNVIVVFASGRTATQKADFTTPTWNGETFTVVQDFFSTDPTSIEIFILKCASSATANIVLTGSLFSACHGHAVVISGTFGTTYYDAPVSKFVAEGAYSLPSIAITGMASGDIAINALLALGWDAGYSDVSSTTHTPNGTQLALTETAQLGSLRMYSAANTGTGSVACSYTKSNSAQPQYTQIGLRIYESGASVTIDSTPADIRVSESRTISITAPTTLPTTLNTVIKIDDVGNSPITPSSVTVVSGLMVDVSFIVADEYAGLPYSATGYPIIVTTTDGSVTSANVPYLPVTGNDYVTLTDVSATDIESSPALEVDDQIEWTNAAVITIGADGKVSSTEASTTFEFRVWDHNDSTWGDWAGVVFGGGGSTGVLTASSLTTSGLTVAGLTRSGLSS